VGLLSLRELSGLGTVVPDWHRFLRNAGCSYSANTDADGVFTEVITPPEGKTVAECISEAQAAATASVADTDLPSFHTPPADELVLCSPPCETLLRKVTQAKCDEWAEQAKTARCQSTVADDWASRPCSRSVPPDCYGRTKVRNRTLRDCYDWACPPGQTGYAYAPGQHYTPSSRAASAIRAEAAAADAAAELASLRARRRALLMAAQEIAQESAQAAARPSVPLPPRPTIAVGEPHPATPPFRPPPLSIQRPAFNPNNLLWLAAGAVAVLALKR
jgi:hypothetical protein